MTNQFSVLNTMKPFLQEAWKKAEFPSPTPIQEKTVPVILEGNDVIAESPTGTGKTLAYLLPLLEKIDPAKKAVQAVILASSRELVMQINDEVRAWGDGTTCAAFIGGANIKRQVEKLKKPPHVVVGTPGRIEELIQMKKLKMHEVKLIVLDEGDQLVTPEHARKVEGIIKSTLKDRQLVMFSATITKEAEELARSWMKEAQLIKVGKQAKADSRVDHLYFVCDHREKNVIVERIIRGFEPDRILAFVKDIGNVNVLSEKLAYKGFENAILHSELNKQQRANALQSFRDNRLTLLFATDIAARGLDIKGLDYVLQFDMPKDAAQYTHRAGRTGRSGKAGTVITLITPGEENRLKKIANELGVSLVKKTFYKGQPVDAADRPQRK
ncbi:DEAD/DEAH box helicase [Bacillus thermotolerans]|uniref:DEAD/DEAH box helicase n=1 Tax=Bacillus thermotolerans TaxID=1221996 RepID=UPI00057D5935|nr:DEAD/DEAH box helicase [Bacillus thermotolerans]KKB37144.1 ATP-dependent RNA helicase YfmL [Bacillus thermotolerans]KKB42618.1 ATP-dependent RNA helicase YfmL [Bacillus thermotolerans]